jgi:uncharacterized protein (DUF1697 family)
VTSAGDIPAQMPSYIALLRAVNLGSHNKIAMADVRELFDALGMRNVKTLLQSGNVVFSTARRDHGALELLFERRAVTNLGITTDFFVRSAAEWNQIVEGNPFAREAKSDPGHLILLAMKGTPDATAVASLRAAIKGRETFHVAGSHAYFVYPDGMGRSKLTVGVIERKLGFAVTGRNWNTVLKIRSLLG